LRRAVELALAGEWKGAHTIVQAQEEDATACWIHAVLHKIEGDLPNSRYWYRRAGRDYGAFPDARTELAAIASALAP
jgi:hypothetical protein